MDRRQHAADTRSTRRRQQRRVSRRRPRPPRTRAGRRAVQGRRRCAECGAGDRDPGRAGSAQRRRQVARASARAAAHAGRRSDGHRLREAACLAIQRPHLRLDAIPVRRPGLSDAGSAHAPGRGDCDHGGGWRSAEDHHDARHARRQCRVASGWCDDRVHGRRHVEERTSLRAARHLHRDHQWRREAPDQRRLRVGLALVFAGRTVPAVGADLRHRDDHREEAVAWRLG